MNAWREPTTSVCCADYRRRLPYLLVLVWHELETQEYRHYDHHCEDHCHSQNSTQYNIDVAWVVCIGLCEEEEKKQCSQTVLQCLHTAGDKDGMLTHKSHSTSQNSQGDSHICTQSHVGYKFLHLHRHFGHTLKTLHDIRP